MTLETILKEVKVHTKDAYLIDMINTSLEITNWFDSYDVITVNTTKGFTIKFMGECFKIPHSNNTKIFLENMVNTLQTLKLIYFYELIF